MEFSILIYDEPNSAALRDEHRSAHLDYLEAFDDQTRFAGPFVSDDETADLGSLRLIDFPDRAAAEKHIADEPYVIGGVQKRWRINRWRAALPHTWRDCPRREGNIQAMFHGLDHPGGAAIRVEHQDAHRAYLNGLGDTVMIRGRLINDAGTDAVGSLWLLDVPDMDAGRAVMEDEPFYKAGLYKDVTFHRWRFGRVLDRLKV